MVTYFRTRKLRTGILLAAGLCAFLGPRLSLRAASVTSEQIRKRTVIQCGNLIYARTRSSVCFADRFLTRVATETNLDAAKKFTKVKLSSDALFKLPFSVFSGEGAFSLTRKERDNLKKYLQCGGFILASPGCSDKKWDRSFRRELKACFPDMKLKKIPMDHVIFSIVYRIPRLTLKHGGTTLLEGMQINGRIALVYSAEGLNDVKYAKGCCCCGGDQINECEKVNVNIFTYSLLY